MLGTEVKRLRLNLGLSQTALARQLHKSRSWLCKIESGALQPSLDAARDLLVALPLDPRVFLCRPPEEPTP